MTKKICRQRQQKNENRLFFFGVNNNNSPIECAKRKKCHFLLLFCAFQSRNQFMTNMPYIQSAQNIRSKI